VGRGEEGEGGVRKVGGGGERLMQVAEDAARREDGRTGRGSGHTTGAEAADTLPGRRRTCRTTPPTGPTSDAPLATPKAGWMPWRLSAWHR